MIKILFVLLLSIPLFSSTLSLYDLGFLVTKTTKKSVIFSDNADKNIKIIIADNSINYLQVFKSALQSNNYTLTSYKTYFYVDVKKEIKDDGIFSSIMPQNPNQPSGNLLPPPPLVSSAGGINVTNGGESLYSGSFGSSSNSLSLPNSPSFDENISFKLLSLVYLKASDLNTSLNFCGFRYSVSNDSKNIIFAVPYSKNSLYKNFIDTIKSIDVPHEQVTIKITVYSAKTDKLRDLGLSPLFNLDSALTMNSISGSFFSGAVIGSFYSSLHALENKEVVNISEAPIFLLSNNELLDFKSVVNVPFLDENVSVASQASTNQTSRFSYKPVGFKVFITPNIVNDTVYLDFSISFEDVLDKSNTPTTSEKSIKNKFSMKKGEMVVLAGISKNNTKTVKDRSPLFDYLPFLDSIFQRDQNISLNESFNLSIEILK